MDLLEKIRGVFQSGTNQAQQSLRGLGNRVVNNAQWAGQQAQRNMPATTAFIKELYKGPQTFGKGFAETLRTSAPSVFGPSNLSLQQSYAKTLQDVGQKNIQKGYQVSNRNLVNSGQKLLNTGAQEYKSAAQGAKQSAINVGLGGVQSAMPVFGAQYALKNPAIVGLGGVLSGAINKVQGGSFREGFGQGAASMVRDSALYQATNPLIAGVTGAAKTMKILKTPVQKYIAGSILSGIGNMGEDEIVSNLLQSPRGATDRVLSFGLGAVASLGGGKIENWNALKESTRKAIIDSADKAGYLTKSARDVWYGAPDVPAFLYDAWHQMRKLGWDGTSNINKQAGFIDLNAEIFPKMKGDVEVKPGKIPTNTSSPPSSSIPLSRIPVRVAPQQSNIEGQGGTGQPPTLPPKTSESGAFAQRSSGDSISNLIGSAKEKLNQLYTRTIDRFHPLSMLAKEAGQEQAMRNAMTGYYGAGSKAEYHVDFELTPILKEHNIDDLRKAAIAFRDIELSQRGIQGSNVGDPQAILKEMEGRLGAEKVKAIGNTLKKLYAYQDKMVKEYLVDTGIINREAYENMRKNNQFYVPFKRVMDQVDDFLGVVPQTKNAGSVASQDVIKGIKGSSRQIVDPIESIIEASYKMVNVGQRQKVAQQIVKLGKTTGGIIERAVGEVGNKPHISLFEDGKIVQYLVPEDIAIAAKGLTDDGVNTLVKILQVPTRVFRASATGLNPEFAIPNVARDLQSAWVNYGVNPLKWVSGLAHFIKKDDVYQEFLKSGGKTSFVAIDRPTIQITLRNSAYPETVQDISGKGISVLHPKRLLDLAAYISEASEMGTRVSLFEQQLAEGLRQGLSKEEAALRAAYAAQEGTVNFARRGADTKSINAIYAFLNARVQGIDRLMRSLKNDPKGAGTRLGFMVGAPAIALYAWNRNFASYDDERVISKGDRERNFIIMLSDKPIPQLGGAQYIKIPKAEVGKLANPLENFLAMLDGKEGKTKEALISALKGFSPIDNVGDIIPTALRPLVEVAANKNLFFNTEIVPNYKINYPAQYQYSSYTAPIYKMIGEKLGASPAKIQAIVEGYATGWAKIAETTMRPLVPQQYKTERDEQGQPINRTPIIRRVLGGERRTEGEQQAIDEKRVKSIDFQINDIKSGVNRNDLPMDIGIQQIQRLRQEQEKLKGATTQPSSRGTYYFKDDEGKLKEVDLSKQIIAPTLTGNKELDKIAMSKYRSALTRRANDIYALYEAGQMSFSEASKQIEALIAIKNSTYAAKAKKPKKVSVKLTKVKAPKIKAFKMKLPKLKKMKQPKIKLLKNKPNTITMKGIKLT